MTSPVTHQREKETNLPKRVTVTFKDEATQYSQGAEHIQRVVTNSVAEALVEVPVVLTPTEARQRAEVLMRIAWGEIDGYAFSVGPDYASLKPTDLVRIDVHGENVPVRIVSISDSEAGVRTCEAVRDVNYTSTVTSDASVDSSATLGVAGPTLMVAMDLPPLRTADDSLGYYLAATGYATTWPGGTVLASSDGGATFGEIATFISPSSIGSVPTATNATNHTTWDRTGTLTVKMAAGVELDSAASELAVLNGENLAAYGANGRWEIVQWVDAAAPSGGTQDLTTLLRGQYGTELFMDDHEDNDRFVVLSTALIQRIDTTLAVLDQETVHRGVTDGQAISDAVDVVFNNGSASLDPYAPTDIAGTRDVSDNLALTWKRRDRFPGPMLWSPPMSENVLQFEIDVLDGPAGTVLNTYTPTESLSFYTYTAADQTTDGLTPGDPVTVRIYQISASVGRGHHREATV